MQAADFPARKRTSGSGLADQAHLKRMAIQLAVQLPEDLTDARQVLEYVRMLIDDFLAADQAGGASPKPAFVSLA